MDFQVRRFKAKSTRIIRQNEHKEEEETSNSSFLSTDTLSQEIPSQITSQSDISSTSSKKDVKKKDSRCLRLSFGLDEDDQNEEIFVAKKSLFSRPLQQKKTEIASPLPLKIPESIEKISSVTPKYNSVYLSELRSSTPSTPKEFCNAYKKNVNIDDSDMEAISHLSEKVPVILDDGIVKALKERRIEKIKQSKLSDIYIPLEDDDQMVLYSKSNESRLQREDDLFDNDGTEGLEEYVDDKILLNRDIKKMQVNQKHNEIKDAIENLECRYEEEYSSDEELRRWEQTQIRKGVYGPNFTNTNLPTHKKHEPIVMEIPNFEDSIKRLKNKLSIMESERNAMLSEIKTLISEKEEIYRREVIVKESLEKASEEYSNIQLKTSEINSPFRGLDSIASYPAKQSPFSQTIS